MALPRISMEVDADVAGAISGLDAVDEKLDRMGRQARRTGQRLRRSSPFGRGLQNASFQLGDFAVQVGAGTSASIALGQQLPQLLGGFGVLGAVLGAVAAIAVPLTRVFRDMSENGRDLTSVLGTMQPVAKAVASAFGTIREAGVQMAEITINNLDRIISVAIAAAAIFGGRLVAGFIAARFATMSLAGAMAFLRGAIVRTGIGALVVGVGELIYQFSRLAQVAGGSGAAFGLLKDVAVESFDRIGLAFNIVPLAIKTGALQMKAFFLTALQDMLQAFQDLTWSVAEGLNNLFGTDLQGARIGSITPDGALGTSPLSLAIREALGGSADSRQDMEELTDQLTGPMESIQKIRDLLASMKDERLDIPSLLSGEDGEDGGGKRGKSAWDRMLENMQKVMDKQAMLRKASQGVWSAMGDFVQQFAGKSKAAAIAVIAIQKGLSIAQIISNTAAAQMRALAELGPIAGPPMAAKIGMYGKVQAALVAATGLAQAAQAGGGAGGGAPPNLSSGGSEITQQASGPSGPRVSLTLIGDQGFSRAQIVQIAEALNDSGDEGQLVELRGRR